MWYIGKEFNVKKNKPYKTLEGGVKAAEKLSLNVFDEKGQIVHQGVPEVVQENQKEVGCVSEFDAKDALKELNENVMVPVDDVYSEEASNDVSVRALDTRPDGSAKIYDECGNLQGETSAEEVVAAIENQWDEFDGVQALRIRGRIRRVFVGNLRIRNHPSWQPSAVRGISAFEEKEVTHLLEVDGKQMYRTVEGYFVSADEKHVEYVGTDID